MHLSRWPYLSAIRQHCIEEGEIVDLTIICNFKRELLTLVAIVEWVEAAHCVPEARKQIVVNFFDSVSRITTLSIINRIRRW